MRGTKQIATALIALTSLTYSFGATPGASSSGPEYTADGQLKLPEDYREWVFLSSGSGMTYGPLAAQGPLSPPLFDNVFVNRESYRRFLETGHWPDKTMFVLEVRSSEGHASINNGGHFQRDLVGIESEVKDSSSPLGTWTFYGFSLDAGKPARAAKPIPRTANCYSCHGTNTAVENTFVQFYPTLYDVAEHQGTIKPEFQKLPITTAKLVELITAQGWNEAARVLEETRLRTPDAAVLSDGSLNIAGHRLMKSNPDGAVAILEWAAARYPKSANTLDSLADAYAAAGKKDAARSASEKELALLDGDTSLGAELRARLRQTAKDRLARLQTSNR